jgi:phosphate transport system substrate-binding protein
MNKRYRYFAVGIFAFSLMACSGDAKSGGDNGGSGLTGTIESDGSSTVGPITQAMAEEFRRENSGVSVPVGTSGTGGGFKRFCAGEIPIANASRPIKESEAAACSQNQVEYVSFTVATDGIAVVVNPANTGVPCLTTAQLKKLWAPNSTLKNWSEVVPGHPSREIKLYGPGTNSGTFDYFTEVINGKQGESRSDYNASEDDNTLVQGVEGDEGALGYFGYSYFEQNQQRLKAVPIDAGAGCVAPSTATIKDGTYKPLSRPLFVYVEKKALQRPEVQAFVRFYMEHAAELIPQVGYVPLDAAEYTKNVAQLGTPSGN